MLNTHQTDILRDCLDYLTCVPALAIFRERFDLARHLSATLKGYPIPTECKQTPKEILAAYRYTSTARNVLELALLGYMPYGNAFREANACLATALGLLTTEKV